MIQATHTQKKLTHCQIDLFHLECTSLLLPDTPAIQGFYDELCQNALSYCEQSLFPILTQAYDQAPDAKARLLFPRAHYTLTLRCTYRSSTLLCIRSDATLKGFFATQDRCYTDAHLWDIHTQRLLPPHIALRDTPFASYPLKKGSTVLLEHEKCYTKHQNCWNSVSPSKNFKKSQS